MTMMMACLSPSAAHREESQRTLEYATRTRNIKNKPTVNVNAKDQLILDLRQDLATMAQYTTILSQALSRAGLPVPAAPDTRNRLTEMQDTAQWSWPAPGLVKILLCSSYLS